MKLFLDANVIFSAAHRDEGRSRDLPALARGGLCELLASAHALEEPRRNLELKFAGFERRLEKALEHTKVAAKAPSALVEWARAQGLALRDAPISASR